MEPEVMSVFLETLSFGAVQSYVDLVYLACDGKTTAGQLPVIREKLIEAEGARRRGDTVKVIVSYNELAQIFSDAQNIRTSVYFLERSLEIARLTGDARSEMMTCKQLGEAYEGFGDSEKSVMYFDQQRKLGEALSDQGEVCSASRQLVQVYLRQATASEQQKDLTQALQLYNAAVENAKCSNDATLLADTTYHAGRLNVLVGNAADAVILLREHVRIVLEPESGYTTACKGWAALAGAHIAAQSWDAAQECLETILTDGQENSASVLAEVYENLGCIHANRGQTEKALEHLNHALELRVKLLEEGIGSRVDFDRLQISLGSVRSAALLDMHIQNVLLPTTTSLLAWKAGTSS